MSHTHNKGFHHFVWSTWNREPLLTEEKKQHAYAIIQQQCKRMKVEILAVGGISDHVHVLVTLPTTLCVADFMEAVKGISANAVNKAYESLSFSFKWQGGYGFNTVSASHVRMIRSYIEKQTLHHAEGSLWPNCELPEKTSALTQLSAPAPWVQPWEADLASNSSQRA